MKVEVPNNFLFTKMVAWDKKKFLLNISIYSGFSLDNHNWLDQESLISTLKKITEDHVILDNGIPRKYQEYFIYDDTDVQDYSFRISDQEKTAPKDDFLPLNPRNRYYKKPNGTFDQKWLFERWPALPEDCDDSALQLAMEDQWSEDGWDWGDFFYIKRGFEYKYETFSLPDKKLKGFYKKIDDKEKKDLNLKPDVLWVIPNKDIAIVISHAQLEVIDQQNSDVTNLYIVAPEDKSAIEVERPKPKKVEPEEPKPQSLSQASELELPKEILELKRKAEQKLEEIKSQYSEYAEKHKSYTPPKEIQQIIDGKVHSDSIPNTIKKFVDNKISDINDKVSGIDLHKRISEIKDTKNSLKESAANLSQMVSEKMKMLRDILPKDKLKQLPEDYLKQSTDRLTKMISEAESEPENEIDNKVEKNCIGKDFSNRKLEDYDFSDCDLTNATFENSRLKNVIFNRSIIYNTCFKDASLNEVSFKDLNVVTSDFSNSILRKLNFKNAFCDECKFMNSSLNEVEIENSIIKQSDLSKVTSDRLLVKASNFKNCKILYSKFTNSSIETTTFKKVEINKLDAEKSNLTTISFSDCNIEFMNMPLSLFEGVNFTNTKINNCNFKSSYFKRIILTKSNFLKVDLSKSDGTDFRINDSEVLNSNFEQVKFNDGMKVFKSVFRSNLLDHAQMSNSTFKASDLNQQRFKKVIASESIFSNCNLSDSLFENTNLFKVSFYQSQLKKTVFTKSNLYGVNFYQANISQAIFEQNLVVDNFDIVKRAHSVRESYE